MDLPRYSLQDDCKQASERIVSLWKKLIEQAHDSLDKEGEYDSRKITFGIRASELLSSYAWGPPKTVIEMTGDVGIHDTTVDAKKLSTGALRELLAAREKPGTDD